MITFADASNPLRCSSLPTLAQCASSVILRRQSEESGEAADTGSMIHAGIAAFHQTGDKDVAKAVMALSTDKFPKANKAKANRAYDNYVARQRTEWGDVLSCETPIDFTLDPAEDDPTQEKIYITGTRDQVRRIDANSIVLVDIKTGAPSAVDMMNMYVSQLAAYQYATMREFPGVVVHSAILRTADFFYGGPVLHYSFWTMEDVLPILSFVRKKVADVRRGHLEKLHGKHCAYCPARNIRHCMQGTTPAVRSRESDAGSLPELDSLDSLTLGDI